MKVSDVVREFVNAVKEGPRIFFAPLVGAINAIRSELQPRPAHIPVRAHTVSQVRKHRR